MGYIAAGSVYTQALLLSAGLLEKVNSVATQKIYFIEGELVATQKINSNHCLFWF